MEIKSHIYVSLGPDITKKNWSAQGVKVPDQNNIKAKTTSAWHNLRNCAIIYVSPKGTQIIRMAQSNAAKHNKRETAKGT
jgi:hypothetical protein